MHSRVAGTHPVHQGRSDPFRSDHRVISGNIQMQIRRMHAPEGSQIRQKGCARPLAGLAMDLASAIPILRPAPMRARRGGRSHGRDGCHGRPATRRQRAACCLPEHVRRCGRDRSACSPVSREMTLLMGAPPGRIIGIAMGRAFVPRHAATVHLLIYDRLGARRSGNESCGHDTTSRTVVTRGSIRFSAY